ncbi:MAG: beta/gamma crystallin-related protein [Vicinamibacterales bacterium]
MFLRCAFALALVVSAFPLDASAQRDRGYGGYNNGYGGITVYEDPNFRGDSVTLRNEVPDLREHGLNDRISSLEVDGNQAWEVCRDINFGGGCRVFQGTIDDLRSEGWNDRISSMRAVGFSRGSNSSNSGGGWWNPRGNAPRGNAPRGNPRNNQSRLVLFDRTNFRGDARNVVNGTSNLGSAGDRARSVQVYGGTWELCDGASRNARCVTVSDSVSDLRSLGFRSGVSSAREMAGYNRNNQNRNNPWWP